MAHRKPLVLQHMENISRSALEEYKYVIREYVRNKHGIYALYRRERLYYVGLASNLRGRLNSHLRDRHGKSWDTFAIYLTIDNRFMKELESLILRITKPIGNRVKGGFAKSENLLRAFGREIRQMAMREIDAVLGRKRLRVRIRGGARKHGLRDKPELGGVIRRAMSLRGRYKGEDFRARVLKNGTVRFGKKRYNTLRAAATAARGRPTSGWSFWRMKNARGEWVRIRRAVRG